jgi:hypothetical protein
MKFIKGNYYNGILGFSPLSFLYSFKIYLAITTIKPQIIISKKAEERICEYNKGYKIEEEIEDI